jgi:hypothetical protein
MGALIQSGQNTVTPARLKPEVGIEKPINSLHVAAPSERHPGLLKRYRFIAAGYLKAALNLQPRSGG